MDKKNGNKIEETLAAKQLRDKAKEDQSTTIRTYVIPTSWEVSARVKVDAISLDAAIEKIEQDPLPDEEAIVVKGSFKTWRSEAEIYVPGNWVDAEMFEDNLRQK